MAAMEGPSSEAFFPHDGRGAAGVPGRGVRCLRLFTYLHRVYERRKGEMHIDTLAVASSCALSLSALKKHEEAALLQDCLCEASGCQVGVFFFLGGGGAGSDIGELAGEVGQLAYAIRDREPWLQGKLC